MCIRDRPCTSITLPDCHDDLSKWKNSKRNSSWGVVFERNWRIIYSVQNTPGWGKASSANIMLVWDATVLGIVDPKIRRKQMWMGIELNMKWLTLSKFHQLYPSIFHMMVAYMPIVFKKWYGNARYGESGNNKSIVSMLSPLLDGYQTWFNTI